VTSLTSRTSPGWLRRFADPADPRRCVVTFPHAGGSASFFRSWTPWLLADNSAHLSVQYPGREDRMAEPCPTDLHALADGVAEALPVAGPPLVLFGHSMGASIAFETALRLQERGVRPVHLVLSGRAAPPVNRRPGLGHLPDDELLAEVGALGGMSAAMADPDLRALVLPAMRADFLLLDAYTPSAGRVNCPVTAVLGRTDGAVSVTEMQLWAASTNRSFRLRLVPGGHFYLSGADPEVLGSLLERW
jgi:pyochelin biosynthetic protein PchC